MNCNYNKCIISLILFFAFSCSAPGGNEHTTVLIKTTVGDITIKLYDETPIHRDNFIKLVNSGFYEGISFHRIIKGFMMQAGDPDTKASHTKTASDTLKTYTIPPEFNSMYFHKKGALAAARLGDDVNPGMRSSGTQFYIVEGTKLTDSELAQAEQKINNNMKQGHFYSLLKSVSDSVRQSGKSATDAQIQEIASMKMFDYLSSYKPYKITEEQKNIYKTIGGTPSLDGTYTVFGEVTDGLRIVDKIAESPTDSQDKPVNDIKIVKIKIISK